MPGRLGLALLFGAATLGHATYRLTAGEERTLVPVSDMELGSILPEPVVSILKASSDEATCMIVVAFDPACVHCGASAERERAAIGGARLLPVHWVTGGPTAGFEERTHPTSRVVSVPGVLDDLGVRAVPAAFLIAADGSVRRTWPYRGDELHDPLAATCHTGNLVEF